MASNVVQQYPNNFAQFQYQFSNIALSLSTNPSIFFAFFTAVEYSDTLDVAEGMGISPYPMGTTLGSLKSNGSLEVMKLYDDQFQALIASASPSGKSLYDAVWSLNVQYQLRAPQGQPQPPVVTDVLNGVRLTGSGMTMSAGNAMLTKKYPLYVGYVNWNGYLPISGIAGT